MAIRRELESLARYAGMMKGWRKEDASWRRGCGFILDKGGWRNLFATMRGSRRLPDILPA